MEKHLFNYILVDFNGFTPIELNEKLEMGNYIIHNKKYYQIRESYGNQLFAFSMDFINGYVEL